MLFLLEMEDPNEVFDGTKRAYITPERSHLGRNMFVLLLISIIIRSCNYYYYYFLLLVVVVFLLVFLLVFFLVLLLFLLKVYNFRRLNPHVRSVQTKKVDGSL